MIAALLQVHNHIQQGHLLAATLLVEGVKVSSENVLVILPAINKNIELK